MAPFSWNGADFIYHKFIAPFVLKHEKDVDQYLKKGEALAKDLYGKGIHIIYIGTDKHITLETCLIFCVSREKSKFG